MYVHLLKIPIPFKTIIPKLNAVKATDMKWSTKNICLNLKYQFCLSQKVSKQLSETRKMS